MKVLRTRTAEDCLGVTWDHDRIYSESHADAFQRDIDHFIRTTIGALPKIGQSWHEPRGIRRMIFLGCHNIFYNL